MISKKKLQQAQMLQKKMQEMQQNEQDEITEATTGGGVVKVCIKGVSEVQSIEIDDELLDPKEKEMLQDLILSAINSALSEAIRKQTEKMRTITSGLGLPGMFG